MNSGIRIAAITESQTIGQCKIETNRIIKKRAHKTPLNNTQAFFEILSISGRLDKLSASRIPSLEGENIESSVEQTRHPLVLKHLHRLNHLRPSKQRIIFL